MKVLFLAPHLSTGGMPAFLLKRIQALQSQPVEIFLFEWRNYSTAYTVQKNEILKLVKSENFYSCGWDDNTESRQKSIIDYCYNKKIDLIHIEEIPEGFDSFSLFDEEIQKELYDPKHPWKIVETCHNIWFNPDEKKKYYADGYASVSKHHLLNTFKNIPSRKTYLPFPIDLSIQSPKSRIEVLNQDGWRNQGEFHIINIGLFTPGKNQSYAIEIARELYNKYGWTYIFHFIGNQASNFKEYWEPLLNNLPPNVMIHGEKPNTDDFFRMADLMLFTSTWECNPIVLKEAISNHTKIMAFNLEHYHGEYTKFITPLSGILSEDTNNLINTIHSPIIYSSDNLDNVEEFGLNHYMFYQDLVNETTPTRKNIN